MKQFWKQPTGINGLLYGQPATIVEARPPRVKPEPTREERLHAESVRAYNNAVQFERDRKQAAKAARRRAENKRGR